MGESKVGENGGRREGKKWKEKNLEMEERKKYIPSRKQRERSSFCRSSQKESFERVQEVTEEDQTAGETNIIGENQCCQGKSVLSGEKVDIGLLNLNQEAQLSSQSDQLQTQTQRQLPSQVDASSSENYLSLLSS